MSCLNAYYNYAGIHMWVRLCYLTLILLFLCAAHCVYSVNNNNSNVCYNGVLAIRAWSTNRMT